MRRLFHLVLVVLLAVGIFAVAAPSPVQAQSAWAPGVSYSVGTLVTYGGHTYKCLQAHTSQVGWEPPNVPALWQDMGVTSGSTPVPPTKTNTPTGPTATRTNTPIGATSAPTKTATKTNTPSSTGTCLAPYVNTQVYVGGDKTSYNGHNWQAKWWTQGEAPSTGGSGVWSDLGTCTGGTVPTNTPVSATSAPTKTNTPAPTSGSTVAPPPPGGKIFAPYIDVSPGSSSAIMQLANNGSGNKHYTLAFILGRGCSASWFGTFELSSSEAAALGTRINELRAAGGDVIVSFGGAAAPELANVCTDVASLQAQYQAVVTKYNLKYVDFDIEDFSPTAIDLRNKALKGLEAANPGLHVHYTLGVLESGFTANQNAVLTNAKSNGTRVDLVNIMAMDYGHAVSDMGAAAISAAQAARSQLNSMGFSTTALGITPMIGVNDSAGETFTLSNASAVVSWANANGIQLMAFWSANRDNGGCIGGGASPSCSGVSQSTWQFSSIFRGFAN